MRTYTNIEILKESDIVIDINEYEIEKVSEYHRHEFVELKYILEGTATEWINDTEYKVGKGHLLYVNCGQTHKFIAHEKLQYVNIMIRPSFISRTFDCYDSIREIFALSLYDDFFDSEELRIQCVKFEDDELDEVERIIERLRSEFRTRDNIYKQIIQGYLTVLFGVIFRKLKSYMHEEEDKVDGLTAEILEYIEENCFEKISLAEIAAKSFYNPAYFGRLLKKHYGISFSTYIKQKRINKACELLLDDKFRVNEVFELVGYQDKSLFLRHFKDVMNMTPTEYRKQNGID